MQRVLDENSALWQEFQKSSAPGMELLTNYIKGLQSIDMGNCPPDFREAFQAHINAWVGSHNELRNQPNSFLEGAAMGAINTFLGEADGGVSRMVNAQRYWAHQRQATAHRVTEIAAKYGAKVN